MHLLQAFDSFKIRLGVYLTLTCVFLPIAIFLGRLDGLRQNTQFNLIMSDGQGYYAYLPSLIIDGDLDFTNQIRQTWRPEDVKGWLTDRTERGYVQNKFPIGFALTLLPLFLAAHGLTVLLAVLTGSPWWVCDGYSVLYQLFCLAEIMGLGLLTFVLMDRLLSRYYRVRGSAIVAAIVVYWAGTHYAYYFFREPFMVHIVSTFWVTCCIALVCRLRDELAGQCLSWWALPSWVFCLALAVVCRPTNLFLLPFVAYLLLRVVRTGTVSLVWRRLPLALVGLLPVLAQMAVWKEMSGHWIYYTYGRERFYWSQPELWKTLFSSRHGLFVWSPMLLLACAGLAAWVVVKRGWRDPLLICGMIACGILWYCNSAWCMWWFGDAFGGRAFLELSLVFVMGLTFGFTLLWEKGNRFWRRLVVGLVLLAIAYNFGLMWLYFKGYIPRGNYLFEPAAQARDLVCPPRKQGTPNPFGPTPSTSGQRQKKLERRFRCGTMARLFPLVAYRRRFVAELGGGWSMFRKTLWCFLVLLLPLWPLAAVQDDGNPKKNTTSPKELRLDLGGGLTLSLVRIDPGRFLMGSPKNEVGRFDIETQHEVEITRIYYLGVYDVTQAQYRHIMGTNPSHFAAQGQGKDKVAGLNTEDFPVERVSWHDALAFCAKVTALPSLKTKKWIVDLPTEAEWEYACRAGTKTPFYNGASLSSVQANFHGDHPYGNAAKGPILGRPTRVGSYAPNPWGLYDMQGNVWQWCKDRFAQYDPNDKKDPQGPRQGNDRIFRGGGWEDNGDPGRGSYCRSAYRSYFSPESRLSCVGFRVVVRLAP